MEDDKEEEEANEEGEEQGCTNPTFFLKGLGFSRV